MARPPSEEGISYFSLDVDMDTADDRIAYIESKHGFVAFGVIVRMLMRIYKNGYYIMWDEREQFLFSRRINVDVTSTLNIVNDCINEGLFDRNLYEKYGILTSHGIQCRYIKACERRKSVKILQEYCLITDQDNVKMHNVTLININEGINSANVDVVSEQGNAGTDNARLSGVNANINQVNANAESAKIPQRKSKRKDLSLPPYNPPKEGEVGTRVGDALPEEEANADADIAEVFTAYGNNIHPVTGEIEADKLNDLLTRYGKVWLIAAIERAVSRNKRSLSYIEGILRNWGTEGFDGGGGGNGQSGGNSQGVYRARKKSPAGRKEVDWSKEPKGLPAI